MPTVEKIIAYAPGEPDPGSPQNGKTSSKMWSPGDTSISDCIFVFKQPTSSPAASAHYALKNTSLSFVKNLEKELNV